MKHESVCSGGCRWILFCWLFVRQIWPQPVSRNAYTSRMHICKIVCAIPLFSCKTGSKLLSVRKKWLFQPPEDARRIPHFRSSFLIIIIAFKGAIRDFLQSPHSAANCLHYARSSGPGAIVCKSRATHRALITCKCHVTRHLVRRDSSAIKFDRVEIAFIWALFYWLNH